MKKILREEWRRAIFAPRFWLALLIGLAFLGYGLSFDMIAATTNSEKSFADLWFYAYVWSLFPMALPLIAAIPFVDSLVIDQTDGFMRYLVFRTSFRKYLTAKIVVNALVSFLVVMASLLIMGLVTNILLPRSLHPINSWQQPICGRVDGILLPLFRRLPDLFIIFISVLAGISAAIYSSFGLALGLVFPNRYLPLAAPSILYLGLHFLALKTRLLGIDWSPVMAVVGLPCNWEGTVLTFVLSPLTVLMFTLLVFMLFGRRKRVLK